MHTSIGKPLVALVSAACLALPATNPTPHDQGRPELAGAVDLAAAASPFDPVPPSARLLSAPTTGTDAAALVAAVDQMADLSGIDTATLLLQLLTAPYHNIYAVSIAAGKAVNAVVQLVSLPLSIATYVLTNRTTEIPAYIQTVRTNLANAVPGIFDSVQSEIHYDVDLFTQLFGGASASDIPASQAKVSESTVAADAAATGTLLLQLATLPFHNVYGVSIAVGKAVNAVVQLVSLPLSAATYVLTNRTTEIPAYVATVRANLTDAVPGIFRSVQSEIDYDKNLFKQLFGGSGVLSTESRQASTVLGSDSDAAVVFDAGIHPLLAKAAAKSEPQAADPVSTTHEADATAQPPAQDEKGSAGTDSADTDAKDTPKPDTSEVTSDPKASPGTTSEVTEDSSKDASSETTSTATPARKTGDRASRTDTARSTWGGKHRKPDAA